MKQLSLICLAVFTAVNGHAATPTAVSESLNVALVQSCNSVTCAVSAKVKGLITVQADIALADAAGFNADTVVNLYAPGLGNTFTLGEDPAYLPGDTSVLIVRPISGFTKLFETINMSWSAGELTYSVSMNGKDAITILNPDLSPLKQLSGLSGNPNKIHEVGPYELQLSASNAGTAFLEVSVSLQMDTTEVEGIVQKGTGESTLNESYIYNSVSFGPPVP